MDLDVLAFPIEMVSSCIQWFHAFTSMIAIDGFVMTVSVYVNCTVGNYKISCITKLKHIESRS
jgi:hypothetical protein